MKHIKLSRAKNISGPIRKMAAAFLLLFAFSCNKLVDVDPPTTSITSTQVFNSDVHATAAMAGVYTSMINGTTTLSDAGMYSHFASGLTTLACGMSADELYNFNSVLNYMTNTLTANNAFYSSSIWTTAYNSIYGANAVIEGLAASKSPDLHDSVRVELTAEAKFVRAFTYYYLVNLFGGVPLVTTIDFNKTANLKRATAEEVNALIIQDLKDAQAVLPEDYFYAKGERIVPNKWAATALLARVYLATGNNAEAYKQASDVINRTELYGLPDDLGQVFLKNSREAIWQLQPYSSALSGGRGNATPEGYGFIPYENPNTGNNEYVLSPQLLNSFLPDDLRRKRWVDSTNRSYYSPGDGTYYYYPSKYKIGNPNKVVGGVPPEYHMVLRLAEQHLIRAEAAANGAGNGMTDAVNDLNLLRKRANVEELPFTLNDTQLKQAVAYERRIELFCEWGHRWLDLKRMGLAHDVLSSIPMKQPWAGDYQLLYPIPLDEIEKDHNLKQNTGYIQ